VGALGPGSAAGADLGGDSGGGGGAGVHQSAENHKPLYLGQPDGSSSSVGRTESTAIDTAHGSAAAAAAASKHHTWESVSSGVNSASRCSASKWQPPLQGGQSAPGQHWPAARMPHQLLLLLLLVVVATVAAAALLVQMNWMRGC